MRKTDSRFFASRALVARPPSSAHQFFPVSGYLNARAALDSKLRPH